MMLSPVSSPMSREECFRSTSTVGTLSDTSDTSDKYGSFSSDSSTTLDDKSGKLDGGSCDSLDKDPTLFPPSDESLEKQRVPVNPAKDFPDGGLTAWLQCAGCFFLWMNSWGLVNCFGVFQTYYSDVKLRGHSDFDIAWIGSLQLSLLGITGLVAGPLFDRGHVRHLVFAGHILAIVGLLCTSFCNEYWQFILAQGLCVGLGVGLLFTSSICLLPTYFQKWRALAMGITATGASVGGIVYSVVFQRLHAQIGFGWTVRVIMLIVFVTAILPTIVLKSRLPPSPARKIIDWTAFRSSTFVLFETGTFVFFLGMYVPYFYSEAITPAGDHISAAVVTYSVAIINTGSLFGRLVPGYFADKFGPLIVILICTIVTVMIAFAWLAVNNTAGLVVIYLFYGFFSGAAATLNPTTLASLCPSLDVLGVRMGMNLVIFGLGALLGNPIAGALLSNGGGGDSLQIFCGATIAASTLFIGLARFSRPVKKLQRHFRQRRVQSEMKRQGITTAEH